MVVLPFIVRERDVSAGTSALVGLRVVRSVLSVTPHTRAFATF